MSSRERHPPTVRVNGDEVRHIRETKALTQLYVAEGVGVSVDTVSRWENNRTQAVRRDNAAALAQALEVPLAEILQEESPQPEAPAGGDTATPGGPRRRWIVLGAVATLARVLVIAAVTILVGGLMWLSGMPMLGGRQVAVPVMFSNVAGLSTGDPVLVTTMQTLGSRRTAYMRARWLVAVNQKLPLRQT